MILIATFRRGVANLARLNRVAASRRAPTPARPIQERLTPPALTACAASPTMKFAPFGIGGLQKFASIAGKALALFHTDKRSIKRPTGLAKNNV